MSLWRQLTYGLRGLDASNRKESAKSARRSSIISRKRPLSGSRVDFLLKDAKRAARLELGNMTVAQEQVRYRMDGRMRSAMFSSDVRFAARQLRNQSRIYYRRDPDAVARRLRQHGDFQRRQSNPF